MISIKDFLFNRLNRVDCHANLYGESALDKYCDIANDSIVMVDYSLRNSNTSLLKYYDELYSNLGSYHVSGIGKDLDETLEIYKKYKPEFIGEVKCYKHFKYNGDDKEHLLSDFSIAMCDKLKDVTMFIHLDLIDDNSEENLIKILEVNENRPVILCHCGMNDIDDKDNSFERALKLQHSYNNLWFEVSWIAWDYIKDNHRIMSKIDTDRLLLGTDFTKYTTEEEMKRHLSYFDYWSSKMNIRRNINKLIKNPAYAQL